MHEKKQPTNDIFKLKISKDASFEEMQDALRQALGNPDFELSNEEYKHFYDLNAKDEEVREQIIEIIGPYYEELKDRFDSESLKRKNELMDIARYIQISNKGIKLIKMGESPDFIVEVGGRKIGIEHTGIFDKSIVAQVSILEKICDTVQKSLSFKHPSAKGLFNVHFNNTSLAKIDKKTVTLELEAYLESIISGTTSNKPNIIDDIIFSPHSALEVVLWENYQRKEIDGVALDQLIAQKEAKLQKYKENCGLETIWLLVIADGATEKSDPSINRALLPERNFAFDKIVVLNTFKGTIIETLK